MKKFLLVSLMATVVAAPCFAADELLALARITPERMEQLQQKVAQDIAKDTWKKRAFYAAALLAGGYLGYRYFTSSDTVAASTEPPTGEQTEKLTKALLDHKEVVSENNKNFHEYFLQKQWGTNWLSGSALGRFGQSILDAFKSLVYGGTTAYIANLMFFSTSGPIQKVKDAVDTVELALFHDRDIKWFWKTRAPYTALFNELESHARCLETGKIIAHTDVQQQELTRPIAPQADPAVHEVGLNLTPEMYEYHVNVFAQTWHQLNERIASLAAFVSHKASLTEGAVQDRMKAGAQQIIMITNATASRLESLLADATYNTLPIDVQYEVRRLRASVSDELLNVNKLEHDISW